MYKLQVINDWKYLFKKYAIGGRMSAFTFFNVSFMRNVDPMVNGASIIILGLGIRLKKK